MAHTIVTNRTRGTELYRNLLVLDGQSVDETTSDSIESLSVQSVTMIVESGAGVNAGVVTLEGAATADYTGIWVSLGTVNAPTASTADALTIDTADAKGHPFPYL